jgi:hypothetical protein
MGYFGEEGWLLPFEHLQYHCLGGFREFGYGEHAITVWARHHRFSSEILAVCTNLLWHTWSGIRTRYWWSKLSTSMFDDTVDYSISCLCSLPILWTKSYYSIIYEIGDISHPQYNPQRQKIGLPTFDRQQIVGGSVESKCTIMMCILILLMNSDSSSGWEWAQFAVM